MTNWHSSLLAIMSAATQAYSLALKRFILSRSDGESFDKTLWPILSIDLKHTGQPFTGLSFMPCQQANAMSALLGSVDGRLASLILTAETVEIKIYGLAPMACQLTCVAVNGVGQIKLDITNTSINSPLYLSLQLPQIIHHGLARAE